MNIYKISQRDNDGYDTFDSAIVYAPDKETARNINPAGGELMTKEDWDNEHSAWASSSKQVTVELIGQAKLSTVKQGLILASFNAG